MPTPVYDCPTVPRASLDLTGRFGDRLRDTFALRTLIGPVTFVHYQNLPTEDTHVRVIIPRIR
jgi:hypothetical protein